MQVLKKNFKTNLLPTASKWTDTTTTASKVYEDFSLFLRLWRPRDSEGVGGVAVATVRPRRPAAPWRSKHSQGYGANRGRAGPGSGVPSSPGPSLRRCPSQSERRRAEHGRRMLTAAPPRRRAPCSRPRCRDAAQPPPCRARIIAVRLGRPRLDLGHRLDHDLEPRREDLTSAIGGAATERHSTCASDKGGAAKTYLVSFHMADTPALLRTTVALPAMPLGARPATLWLGWGSRSSPGARWRPHAPRRVE